MSNAGDEVDDTGAHLIRESLPLRNQLPREDNPIS